VSAKVRYGMVGGGEGAFIGAVHRTAAAIAGNWDLAAGAFSATPDKARRSAAEIGVARGYDSWQDMLAKEAALPADRRIQAVSIVTPNFLHAPVAIAAMEAGFDVICDKPVADTLEAARSIAAAAARTGRRIAITHTYTGSAGQAGARTGGGRRTGAPGDGEVYPGLAVARRRPGRQQAGGLAHRSQTIGRGRRDRRHRHPRLQPGGVHHRPAGEKPVRRIGFAAGAHARR
jgi:hypothetical protein